MTATIRALLTLALVLGSAAVAQARERGPRLRLEPDSLSFVQPGESHQVAIRNIGDQPLKVLSVGVWQSGKSADFTNDPVAFQVVAPGATLSVRVSYRPEGTPGQTFAGLQVLTDDRSLRYFERAPLSGYVGTVALRAGKSPPLLSLLVFFPLLGIPLLFLVPAGRERATRSIALVVSAVPLGIAGWIFLRFDRALGNGGVQFVEHRVWIRGLNVEYFLGVDGLSVTMVLLTTLISVVAVGASWSIRLDRHIRGYFSMLLLLQVGMAGVFCALDFFLFYVFWEVMLLPMYFLIGIWGGPRKEYAAIKFFLYTLVGSVLMLLGVIALYYASASGFLVDGTPAPHTFDLIRLAYDNDFAGAGSILGFAFPKLVWLLFFIAFAIKVPMVPLHTWLPDAHVEAPTAISVVLAGVLLKMGTYGMLRVNWAILPEATHWAAEGVAWLGVISILYGSFCAMAQKDLKRLVAYSSVGHMGFCLLGMSAMTHTGLAGALFQMWSHGIISAMLFLLVGVLYDRTHTRGLDEFGGVATVMPRYAGFFGFAFMASLGLPGLSGFIGEALVFIGAFPVWKGLVAAAALSLVVTAAYHLIAIQRVQLGQFNERWRTELSGHDLRARELLTLVPLAVMVLVLGFWPSPILDTVATAVGDLLTLLGPPR